MGRDCLARKFCGKKLNFRGFKRASEAESDGDAEELFGNLLSEFEVKELRKASFENPTRDSEEHAWEGFVEEAFSFCEKFELVHGENALIFWFRDRSLLFVHENFRAWARDWDELENKVRALINNK